MDFLIANPLSSMRTAWRELIRILLDVLMVEVNGIKHISQVKRNMSLGMNGAIIVTTDGDHEANVLCTGTYACNDDVIFEQKK